MPRDNNLHIPGDTAATVMMNHNLEKLADKATVCDATVLRRCTVVTGIQRPTITPVARRALSISRRTSVNDRRAGAASGVRGVGQLVPSIPTKCPKPRRSALSIASLGMGRGGEGCRCVVRSDLIPLVNVDDDETIPCAERASRPQVWGFINKCT
ncbi:hypothetical protein BKA93DRAFT_760515 [Sparassis latifolia]